MPDNTLLNPGSGGDTIRTLSRTQGASVPAKTEVVQLDLGGGDANAENLVVAGVQSTASSVPVAIAPDQGPVPVSGTVQIGNQVGDLSQEIPVVGRVTADIVALAGTPLNTPILPVSVQGTVPVSFATPYQVNSYLYSASGQALQADVYGGITYLHVDSSAATADGSPYNSVNTPQVEIVAGNGSDGNAHSISVDSLGIQNVNIATASVVDSQILSVLNAILAQLQLNGAQLGAMPAQPNIVTLQ